MLSFDRARLLSLPSSCRTCPLGAPVAHSELLWPTPRLNMHTVAHANTRLCKDKVSALNCFSLLQNKQVSLDFTTELTPPPQPRTPHRERTVKLLQKWKKSAYSSLPDGFPAARCGLEAIRDMCVCECVGGSISPESGGRHCPLAVYPISVLFTPLCTSIHSLLPLTCF